MSWLETSQKIYPIISREIFLLKKSLKKELTTTNTFTKTLNRNLLSFHGKYLRPTMFFLSYHVAKKSNKPISENSNIIEIATAVELIHTATLLHDDVIDGGKIRRNKSTINLLYGNDVAVLLGDKLFAKAFFILSRVGNIKIIQLLSKVVYQICLAEINHTLISRYPATNILTENEYLKMIKAKTADFFAACCQCGVISGDNTDTKILNSLSNYGEYFGMAFQIMDDIVDLVGDEKKEGKTLRSDLIKGKITLPVIYLLKSILDKKKINYQKYPTLRDIWEKHKDLWNASIKKAFSKVDIYIQKAQQQLNHIPDSIYKEGFLILCEYLNSKKREIIHNQSKNVAEA